MIHRFIIVAAFILLPLNMAADCSPIVGAECLEGFIAVEGMCVQVADGGGPDGGGPDGGPGGGGPDGGSPDGGGPDGGPGGGGPDGGGPGGGEPTCEEDEVPCRGLCRVPEDFEDDPQNCGVCGRVCASGFCENGVCQDTFAGHAVVIGHDYCSNTVLSMERLLRNAITLSGVPAPRVAVVNGSSLPCSRAAVLELLQEMRDVGGVESIQNVAFASVPALLPSIDVLVIPEQQDVPNLEQLGMSASAALNTFVNRRIGGVIVQLEGPGGESTIDYLRGAGVMDATSNETTISGLEVDLVAQDTLLARGVSDVYRAGTNSTTLTNSDMDSRVIVSRGGVSVVIQRVFE